MINPQQVEEPYGNRHVIAPNISPKFATAAKCAMPVCGYLLLGRYKNRSHGLSKVKAVPEKERILARDKYEVGDFFPQIKSLCARLEAFHLDMVANVAKIYFTAVPSIMILRMV